MTRITVDVNDEWLATAQQVLDTETKVATINGALHKLVTEVEAEKIVRAFDEVPMDFAASAGAFGYGGGRDLANLVADATDDERAV